MDTCKLHIWHNKRKYGDSEFNYVDLNDKRCFFCKENLDKGFVYKKENLREAKILGQMCEIFTPVLTKNNV